MSFLLRLEVSSNSCLPYLLFNTVSSVHRLSTEPEFAQQSDPIRRIFMSHIPPAPAVTPTTRSASSQVPMDVDPTTPTTSNIRPQLPAQHPASAPSLGACCSVSRGRAEVQELLLNFQEGLNRVLESNLENPLVTTPAAGNAPLDGFAENSASAPPPSLCSVCTKNIASPLNSQWYSCASCHIVVVSDLFVNHFTKQS
jgi:next-to-BRCA1 protein 1